MKKTLTRAAVGGATLLLGVALASGTAAAEAEEHCTFDTATGDGECFTTLDAAISAVEEETGSSGVSTMGAEANAQNDVIHGTFFTERNYGGGSLTIWGKEPCDVDGRVDFEYNVTDEFPWIVNNISSVQPWATCWIWLYPEHDLGGRRDGPYKENTPYVGDYMNNRTMSIGFS